MLNGRFVEVGGVESDEERDKEEELKLWILRKASVVYWQSGLEDERMEVL